MERKQPRLKGRRPHRMLTFRWSAKADKNGEKLRQQVERTKSWV